MESQTKGHAGVLDEISLQICRNLWLVDGTKELFGLSLMNTKYNRCANALFYRELYLEFDLSIDRDWQLIRTLLSNHTLAQHVRKFFLGTSSQSRTEMPSDIDQVIRDAILGNTLGIGSIWQQVNHRRQHMLLFEVLLSWMDNLEQIGGELYWDSSDLGVSSLYQGLHEITLPTLKSAEFDGFQALSEECDLGYVHALVLNSQLESMLIREYEMVKTPPKLVHNSICGELRTLKLHNCTFDIAGLDYALSHCGNIRTFAYTLDVYDDECRLAYWPPFIMSAVTAAEVVKILQVRARHLESLYLSVNATWAFVRSQAETTSDVVESDTIPVLHDFENLRELRFDRFDFAPTLQGDRKELWNGYENLIWKAVAPHKPDQFFEKLPKSLEVLGITGVTESIIDLLAAISGEVSRQKLPNLRQLELHAPESKPQPIIEACRGQNLQILHRKERYSN